VGLQGVTLILAPVQVGPVTFNTIDGIFVSDSERNLFFLLND